MMERQFSDLIKLIDFSGAKLFPKYGVEQPHLPVIGYCLDNLKIKGLFLEFGVWVGISTNFIANKIYPYTVYAFDSFRGLEQEWNGLHKDFFKIDYTTIPFVSNVKLEIGYFSDTLPLFLQNEKDNIAFLNIDCDLYLGTKYVLSKLNDRIKIGTIIYFDELYNYPEYEENEYKALQEWCKENNREYKIIAYNDVMGVAIEVTK